MITICIVTAILLMDVDGQVVGLLSKSILPDLYHDFIVDRYTLPQMYRVPDIPYVSVLEGVKTSIISLWCEVFVSLYPCCKYNNP